jgi:hypothetical protein
MVESNNNEVLLNNESNYDNHDDGASQSSQRSLGGRSASLLERIQRQRELETATTTTNSGAAAPPSSSSSSSSSSGTIDTLTLPSVPQPHLLPQPHPIQVPQYGPMPGFGNSSTTQQASLPLSTAPMPQSGYLNNAWNSFTQSMGSSTMADKSQLNVSPSYDNDEMHHALLPPAGSNTYMNADHVVVEEDYSISQYFLTFVKDIYGLFIWLPIAVRIVVVAGLLYVVVKFI